MRKNPRVVTNPDIRQIIHTKCGEMHMVVWSNEKEQFVSEDGSMYWDEWMITWRCKNCRAPMDDAMEFSNKRN